MVPQRLRCLFRKHRWHNGWDEERHQTVWTCLRCGLVKTDITPAVGGGGGGFTF